MPAPRPEELAAAYAMAALDSGQFPPPQPAQPLHPGQQGAPDGAAPPPQAAPIAGASGPGNHYRPVEAGA